MRPTKESGRLLRELEQLSYTLARTMDQPELGDIAHDALQEIELLEAERDALREDDRLWVKDERIRLLEAERDALREALRVLEDCPWERLPHNKVCADWLRDRFAAISEVRALERPE